MPATRISIRGDAGSTLCILDLSHLHSDQEVLDTLKEAATIIPTIEPKPLRLLIDIRNSYLAPPVLDALMVLVRACDPYIARRAFVCVALMERLAYRHVRRYAAMNAREFKTRGEAVAYLAAEEAGN